MKLAKKSLFFVTVGPLMLVMVCCLLPVVLAGFVRGLFSVMYSLFSRFEWWALEYDVNDLGNPSRTSLAKEFMSGYRL